MTTTTTLAPVTDLAAHRASRTAYAAARRRAISYGTWRPQVPVGPVRDHIAKLRAASMRLADVASVSGVSLATVKAVAYGRSERLRADLADALLAVRPPHQAARDRLTVRLERLARATDADAEQLRCAATAPSPTSAFLGLAIEGVLGEVRVTDAAAVAMGARAVLRRLGPLSPDEVARMARLLSARGLTPRVVARLLSVSTRSVYRYLATEAAA